MHFGGNWFKARDCSDTVPLCAHLLAFNLIIKVFNTFPWRKKIPFEEMKNGAIIQKLNSNSPYFFFVLVFN